MKKNIKLLSIINIKSPYGYRMDFFVLLFFLPAIVLSQSKHLDSIKDSFSYKPKFLIKLDSKYSFVSNQIVSMRGIKLGANYNNKVKLGIGYSWMKNNFQFDSPTEIINNNKYDLRYSYISLFYDYNFLIKDKWSFLINNDFAVVKIGYQDKIEKQFDYKSFGIVIEPSLISEYRFLNYLVLGTGLGYRFVFREEKSVQEKFSAPILILRLKIDFNKIYSDYIKN